MFRVVVKQNCISRLWDLKCLIKTNIYNGVGTVYKGQRLELEIKDNKIRINHFEI